MNKRILWSLVVATALVAGFILAATAVAGNNNMAPGMMGNYGMMSGAAAATESGPGTAAPRPYDGNWGGMNGYGRYGMGRGMMGGYGMGSGMMGGYGMGSGMMGNYGARFLGLSSEQRRKIAGIWNGSISKAWPIMGQLREQYFQFGRLVGEEKPDRATINKLYTRISNLRGQLLNLRLDARQQMMGVLTADQRKKMQQGFYHHWR